LKKKIIKILFFALKISIFFLLKIKRNEARERKKIKLQIYEIYLMVYNKVKLVD